MASIEPYTISIPDAKLEQLQKKLEAADFPDELDEAEWAYGAPLGDVKRLALVWKNQYDWRKQEAKLNQLPNFHVAIPIEGFETLDIHFVHQKSEVQGAIPLLFCHGWPGSFIEITKLLPLLVVDGKDTPAFHVVAPSLPNFAFSTGTRKRGFHLPQYAETCHKLMLKLGYGKYVTQGGDWGAYITRIMDLRYPDNVCASHINMISAQAPTLTSNPLLYVQHALTPYSKREKANFDRLNWFFKEGSGYLSQQSTKPQTLGYALADSPVGLLAWIYEKLHDWTDEYPWTDDEILTWVSIYWFSTAGPAASLRIYYEIAHNPQQSRVAAKSYIPKVKLGLAYFPKEVGVVPKTWGKTLGPVVFESEHESGGHLAAWERPDAIVRDLREMLGKKGRMYRAVEGKDGYEEGEPRS